ncbi:hypothetical protein FJ422_06975 [Mesorhizobium sp. B2-6-3]|nr:hypothetical protein FJ422_06975 [Mesorhizobium sp. B2-6-3]TPK12432.1 hypothetical protein FJ490_09505 [Mesorhizobium sp. B2-5-11]TPK33616.1 hypothetical protein FJ885_12755 [Mesorhizobium sp. B2-5-8]
MAPFLSLRRGERWPGAAGTEWGKPFAKRAAAAKIGTTMARKKTWARLPGGSNASREGRPPLRRAALDTSPPIDGGEEGRHVWRTRDSPLLPQA